MLMQNNKIVWVGILIAIVIAVGGYFFPLLKDTVGAIGTRFPNGLAVGTGASISTAGELVVGTNGGSLKELRSSTCNLATSPNYLPLSTTTRPFSCPITGLASGDQVYVQLSDTGESSAVNLFVVAWARASSTAGFVDVGLSHLGGATSSFPIASTSIQVWSIDN